MSGPLTRYKYQLQILRQIINLSYPVIISLVLQTTFNIIDTAFVGRISAKALAAVAIVFPVSYVVITFISGINIGTTNLIGRYLGARKRKKAANVAEHAFLIALFVSIFLTLFGLIFAKELFIALGAKEFIEETLQYFKYICISFIFVTFSITAEYILRGEKDVWSPFKYLFYALLINTFLDALFILKLGLGIKGAALATLIARAFSTLFLFLHIAHKKTTLNISLKYFKYNSYLIKNILKIGLPSALAQLNVAFGLIALNRIAALFGPLTVAAFGLGFRLDSIAFMPTLGIAAGTLILISHHVGAKEFKKAKQAALLANWIAALFMEGLGVLFFLFPKFWMGLFTNNPEVIILGSSYIRIICLSYLFIAIGMITGASYYGYGRTLPAIMLSFGRLWLIAIPLSFILASIAKMNAIGIWIALLFSNIVSGIIAAIWIMVIPEKSMELNWKIFYQWKLKLLKK